MPAKRKLKIDYIPTAALIPNEKNARIHSDAQLKVIINSIKRFDFIVPIIRDDDLNIIAGHGRVLAAQKLGLDEVPTINVKHLSDREREEFMHTDNRIGDLSFFDQEKLASGLFELITSDEDRERLLDLGWSKYELDLHLGDDNESSAPDEFPEYGADIETKHECPKCGFSW